ncbi:MAG: hypothetical protein GC204_19175 [Chloroflexi bacterium]|nr:hypothetical protein [Chloroflexota bacterium]
MPVLLLARGDQDSKSLLRHAIEARYGLGPPAIETLMVQLKGRTRAKIGPVATWVPVEGTAYFRFPFSMRWNFTLRPAGVSLSSDEAAFDGAVCRTRHNHEAISVVSDAEQVVISQARVWTAGAILLMPLAEHYVELSIRGERQLDATHIDAHTTTCLTLNEDHTLESTATECINPSTGKLQNFSIQLSEGQEVIGELMLPRKISVCWDSQPELELSPVAVEINAAYSEALFRLENS